MIQWIVLVVDAELVSLALLLGAATVPALLWGTRAWSPPRRGAALVLALAGCASLAWAMGGSRDEVVHERDVTSRPIRVPEDGYVSSDACRACHPHEYATWHGSFHRTMTQVVTPDTLAGELDGAEIDVRGEPYRFEERGNELWVEMPVWSGLGEAPRVWKQVVMSTGSHYFQAFWVTEGGGPGLALIEPIYIVKERRLSTVGAVFIAPPDMVERLTERQSSSRWNYVCSNCHATHPTRGEGAQRDMNVQVAEFGIACEACHGPAEEHVQRNRSPGSRYGLHVSGAGDGSIVNPVRLAPARVSEVCGQCHGTTAGVDRGAYRPGDELFATRELVHVPDTEWPDGMVRINGRELNGLLASPCFVDATSDEETMTCLSCHVMHQDEDDDRPLAEWAEDQLAPGMRDNAGCVQCHVEYADEVALSAHTHHGASSAGSLCYDCHMPNTAYGMMKATRSHQIDSPDVDTVLASGRPAACNLCHLDRTLAWTAEHLRDWYGQEPPALSDEQREIADSVLWTIRGNAGQRVLLAWHMGWPQALDASGAEWTVPYLALLMRDAYAAIRFIAWRSLRGREGFRDLSFDYIGPEDERQATVDEVLRRWNKASGNRAADARLLIRDNGRIDGPTLSELLRQRDMTPILLSE